MAIVTDLVDIGYVLRDKNSGSVILGFNSTNSEDIFLPPNLSYVEAAFDVVSFAEFSNNQFSINAVWVGGGSPPPTPQEFSSAAGNSNWQFSISAPGFTPNAEGFRADTCSTTYLIHYAPNASSRFSVIFRIRIVNVTSTSLTFWVVAVHSGITPSEQINYFSTNNAFYICQHFDDLLCDSVGSFTNFQGHLTDSPLSNISFQTPHNNALLFVKNTSNKVYINSPNTPQNFKDPLGDIRLSYTNVLARLAHFYSFRNNINWSSNAPLSTLWDSYLYYNYDASRQNLAILERKIKTCYPNQTRNLTPLPVAGYRLTITQITQLVFHIRRNDNSNFPANAYVFVTPVFDESLHASACYNQHYLFVNSVAAFGISANTFAAILPISTYFQCGSFKLVAGAIWFDTNLNDYVAIYSEPLKVSTPGTGDKFDIVFIGTSNRTSQSNVTSPSFEPLLHPQDIQRTALSYRGSVDNKNINIPPYDSIYLNGLFILDGIETDAEGVNSQTLNQFYRNVVEPKLNDWLSRAKRVRAEIYGENALGQRTLVFSFEVLLNVLHIYRVVKHNVFYNLTNNQTTINPNRTHLLDISEVGSISGYHNTIKATAAPRTLMLAYDNPFFRGSIFWNLYLNDPNRNNVIEQMMNFYEQLTYTKQPDALRKTLWRDIANVQLYVNFIKIFPFHNTFALHVSIAVPLYRYINSTFYASDTEIFGANFKTQFRRTVFVLKLLDNTGATILQGEQVSKNNHRFDVEEYNVNYDITLNIKNYQPLNYVQVVSDTATTREYSLRCSFAKKPFYAILFNGDTRPDRILDMIYVNALGNGFLSHQSFFYSFFGVSYYLHSYFTKELGGYLAFAQNTGTYLTFNPSTGIVSLNKSNLGVGRYYVYFRAIDEFKYTWSSDTIYSRYVEDNIADNCMPAEGIYELDEFRVLPPPPNFDLVGTSDNCLRLHRYLCNETVRILSIEDIPVGSNIQKYTFENQELDRRYYMYVFTAQRACDFKAKDFCGVEIVNTLTYDTITIKYFVRGRIDEVEIYNPAFTDADYMCMIRFIGRLVRDTEQANSEEYITAVTKDRRSIFRRYTPKYTLTLYLYSACQLAQLILMLKAQYWIVETHTSDFAQRLQCVPNSVKYEVQDNTYKATIELEESRWPGEYRFPLR